MKEIIENYGQAILIFIVVIALIAVLTALLSAGEGGVVFDAFSDFLSGFFSDANGRVQ